MTYQPNNADVQMAVETAKWRAVHNQRYVAIYAIIMSVSLFLAIVLWDHWWLAGVATGALGVDWYRKARNREMLRLHRLGAVRWMGAPKDEFGKALK